MHALLSVPEIDSRVKRFLLKAHLEDVLASDDDLVASQTVHYNTVGRVLSVGYIFELSSGQRERFVVAAKKSLRRMRRAMDHMVRTRRRCILAALWSVARVKVAAEDFGPLECSMENGRPELFNRKFFTLLDKAAKRKALNSEETAPIWSPVEELNGTQVVGRQRRVLWLSRPTHS